MNVEIENSQFNMLINEIRTQAESINNLEDKIEEVGENITTTIYSGDQFILNKLEQTNYNLGVLEIVMILILIYHFIERCFR